MVITNDAPVITGLRDTTISINDVIEFSIDATDSNGGIQEYYWDFGDGSSNQYDTTASKSIAHQFPSTDMKCTVSVTAIDSFNKPSTQKAVVSLLQDIPAITLGPETTVSINDTFNVLFSGADVYGSVVKYRFDLNEDGSYEDSVSTSGTKRFKAPSTAGNYTVIVQGQDDDGNTRSDTMPLHVLLDAPVAKAGPDTSVLSGWQVQLHGIATQDYGFIRSYEWRIGANPWTQTSSGDTSFSAPFIAQVMVCSLRVTDDDSNRVVDAVAVTVALPVHGMAGSGRYTLFTRTDGSLWASGFNEFDQFGDASRSHAKPVQVMTDVQAVAAGDQRSFILKSDGTLWGCGLNNYGQLGDGTTTDRYSPVQVMLDVQSIAISVYHSLFLRADNTLWTCGQNHYGQLGDDTYTDRAMPVLVMAEVQAIAANNVHSLILKTNGTLWACGYNYFGQLGFGITGNQPTPIQVMTGVQAIAAGLHHSLILKTNGTLWACGENSYGQLGDRTRTNRPTPIQVMTDVLAIAAGKNHSLILKADSTLWTCGDDSYYQLGDGAPPWFRSAPLQIATGVQAIAAGSYNTLILKADGSLWTCGLFAGQFDDTVLSVQSYISPERVVP